MKTANQIHRVDTQLIKIEYIGHQTAEDIKQTRLELQKLLAKLPAQNPPLLLVDITKTPDLDAGAQLQAKDYFKINFTKMAVVGGRSSASKQAKKIIKAAGTFRTVKYFESELQAIKWLHGKKSQKIQFPWRVATVLALLLLAALAPWFKYAVPRLTALPANFSYSAKIISYDNFYDASRGQFSGKTRSDTTFNYAATRLDKDIIYLKNIFDVRQKSGEPIFSVSRDYAVNRTTKQHVATHTTTTRSGFLFGPTDSRETYTYWHVNYNQPIRLSKVASEQIQGLKTTHYRAKFLADQTRELGNLTDVGIRKGVNLDVTLDVWIEPNTGWLVQYQDQADAYFYNLTTGKRENPWNSFSNSFTHDSIAEQATAAHKLRQKTILYQQVLPAIIIILSIFILFANYIRFMSHRLKSSQGQIILVSIAMIAALGSLLYWLLLAPHFIFPDYFTPAYPGITLVAVLGFTSIYLRNKLNLHHTVRRTLFTCIALVAIFLGFFGLQYLGDPESAQPALHVVSTRLPFILPFAAIISALYLAGLLLYAISVRHPKIKVLANVCMGGTLALALFGFIAQFFTHSLATHVTFFACVILICLAINSLIESNRRFMQSILKYGPSFWIASALFLILLAISGSAWQYTRDNVQQDSRSQFEYDAKTISADIGNGLEEYGNALIGASGLFSASSSIERDEWKAYVDKLSLPQNYPGLTGVGYAQIIPKQQLKSHVDSVRSEGFPNYNVKPLTPERDVYTSIVYLEPFDKRNQAAFGFDMSSEITRRTAMERARDTGLPAMSRSVILLQEITSDVQYGFLTYVPVYDINLPTSNPNERKAALQGYVYSPYRLGDFIEGVVGNLNQGINFSISDTSSDGKSERVIYASSGSDSKSQSGLTFQDKITFAGHSWKLRYTGTTAYTQSGIQDPSAIVLLSGLALSVGLPGFILVTGSSRRRAILYAENITADLKTQKNEVEKIQNKQESILSAMGDGVIVCNSHGLVELFNRSASLLSGYNENEVIGEKLDTFGLLVDRKDATQYQQLQRLIAVGKDFRNNQNIGLKTKTGEIVPVSIVITAVKLSANENGIIIIVKDISGQVKLDIAKEEFLSIASHQLQTPATAVKQYIGAILEGYMGKISDEVRENLEYAYESNDRQIRIVGDMLSLSHLESGRLKTNKLPIDVVKIVEDSVSDLRATINERKQSIRINTPDTITAEADKDFLRIVVDNLISNASKYTGDGGTITVTLRDSKLSWELIVEDTGVGMSDQDTKKLFTKFGRVNNELSTKRGGTGLGLYITKKIVQLHNGTIRVESEAGSGTKFIVNLAKKGK